jgi:hypothetical protein
MAGILNNKERILDSIITLEGRRQIVGGKLKIEFASFSDKFTFYEADVVSGSSDASERVFFEAVSLPQDQVTFEADDSGRLLSFEGRNFTKVVNGKPVVSGSFLIDKTQFASTAESLLNGSFNNFCGLRPIGSKEFFRDDKNFLINPNNIRFKITDERPLRSSDIQSISLDKAESFFQDKRLSHIKNFKFLPPKNKPTPIDPEGSIIGEFRPLSQPEIMSIDELLEGLKIKDFEIIYFSETSRFNNIFCQFFEITGNDIKKLDVIDFGSFPSENGENFHVFFVGKIYVDQLGRSTFINLFTLIFE